MNHNIRQLLLKTKNKQNICDKNVCGRSLFSIIYAFLESQRFFKRRLANKGQKETYYTYYAPVIETFSLEFTDVMILYCLTYFMPFASFYTV